jgi:formyltetrahydrofolate deformylase
VSVLLLSCPDRPGIVAAVAGFLHTSGGNIVDADQHTDRAYGRFLQRVEFDLPDGVDADGFRRGFSELAGPLDMDWRLHTDDEVARIVILVSHQGHCLADLLGRSVMGELDGTVAAVVSNHTTHEQLTARFDIPFRHLPVDPEDRRSQHADLAHALDELQPDLIVMARYMQILPTAIVEQYRHRIINIHHSFLPAFVGAKPYHQAYERGVKLIGATAHYATAELDQGPIICQDVGAVSHRDDVDRLIARGRDLEMVVLARAVQLHLGHRVLAYANRTVVFD